MIKEGNIGMKWFSMLLRLLLLSFILQSLLVAKGEMSFFEKVDVFLKKNVKDGLVDYKSIKKDPAELNALANSIATFDLSSLAEGNPQKAFWLNAYNILVIKGIIDTYPTKSPLDTEGFFNKIKYTAAGKKLTLDNIENDIVLSLIHI